MTRTTAHDVVPGEAPEPGTQPDAHTATVAEPRVAAWEQRVQWPLTGAAVLFLTAYAWNVLDTSMATELRSGLRAAMWATWVLFAADYVARLCLAQRRARFVARHILDLIVIVLPMFRQLRLLRIVTLLSVLNRSTAGSVRGRVGVYVAGATLLLGFCAALAVLEAERFAPDATITSFPDALWWTITTISTVGYGDYSPVTAQGKLVAAGLMVGGIALLGVVTASIASWFVEHIRGTEEATAEAQRLERATRAELAAVRTELADLRQYLAERDQR